MDVVFDNISSLLVSSVLFLIVYVALLNIYFIHKNGFQIGVNCWFCNKNSKVLYAKRNSFECPHCFQYNGFNKQGDYNKVIKAQHNASLNNANTIFNKKTGYLTSNASNGLCDSCNKNQQLKVLQLARYEPLNKKNYEKEIEHFEKQLEKTYGLCKTCSKTVENTIRKQNAWIFGNKLKNLKSSNKNRILTSKVNKQYQGPKKLKFYNKFSVISFSLLTLSVFNLVVLCGFESFIPNHLLPKTILPTNVIFSKIYSYIYSVTVTNLSHLNFVKQLPKTIRHKESSVVPISLIGFVIDLLFTFIEKKCTFFGKFGRLFSWIILGLTSAIHFKHDLSMYTSTLQVFCLLWLVYSYGSTCISVQGTKSKKYTFKRLRKTAETIEYSDEEESSSEPLNNSRASYRTAKHSPITASSLNNSLNKSFESVRSRNPDPLLNSTFTDTNGYTANNGGLDEHFNELNLGAFAANKSMSGQSFYRPTSPNPFLNVNSRPQSPNGVYNYGWNYNNLRDSLPQQSPQNNLFKLQNLPRNLNSINIDISSQADNQTTTFLNRTSTMSPRSDRSDRMSVQSQPYTLANNSNNIGFMTENQQSSSFVSRNNKEYNTMSPRGAYSEHSVNTTMTQRSPVYSLRSHKGQEPASFIQNSYQPSLNNSFRPLSPDISNHKLGRTLLSPSKLNLIKSFHSDGKENENLSLSVHAFPNSSFWNNMNGSHVNQRFVVNNLTNVQSSPLHESLVPEIKDRFSNSRSSSSSSGFISNGDLNRVQSNSLPNSRNHSPDRNSLLSEPAYHLKLD